MPDKIISNVTVEKKDRRIFTFSYTPEDSEVSAIEEARKKLQTLLGSEIDYRQTCVLIFRKGISNFLKGEKK